MVRFKTQIVVLLLIISPLIPLFSQEQAGSIEGVIRDADSGKGIYGANVYLRGTFIGSASDSTGTFTIERIPPGQYELIVRVVGYETFQKFISFKIGETIFLEVDLNPTILITPQVLVEEKRTVEQSISAIDIQKYQIEHTAGVIGDPIRVLHTLPAVTPISDYSSQLTVRGGSPDQNLIILDNINVLNTYRLGGFISLFNPAIVDEILFYPGGFPARYGDRISSVLLVSMRPGNPKKTLGGEVDANLTNTSVSLEGKTHFWNGSWLIAGRHTYFDLLKGPAVRRYPALSNVAFPDYSDVQAKISFIPSPRNRINITSLYSHGIADWRNKERLGETESTSGKLDGESSFSHIGSGIKWDILASTNLQLSLNAHLYRVKWDNNFSTAILPQNEVYYSPGLGAPPIDVDISWLDTTQLEYQQEFDISSFGFGSDVLYNLGNHEFSIGIAYSIYDNIIHIGRTVDESGEMLIAAMRSASGWFSAVGDVIDDKLNYYHFGLYFQDMWEVMRGKLYITPGFRFDSYSFTKTNHISPRFNLAYRFTPVTTIKGAIGRFVQSPGYEKIIDDADLLSLARYERFRQLRIEEGIHYIIGLSHWFSGQWRFTIESYIKEFDNLIIQSFEETVIPSAIFYPSLGYGRAEVPGYQIELVPAIHPIPVPSNDATGTAVGLEVLIEKKLVSEQDRLSGLVSYTYSKAVREVPWNNETVRIPFDYDRRHAANIVVNYRFGKKREWNTGLTWRYGTGLPYTPPLNVQPLVASVDDNGNIQSIIISDPETGYIRFAPNFGNLMNVNSSRLPDYHRLDMRVSYTLNLGKTPITLYADIINVYKRNNTLYYRSVIRIIEDHRENIPPALKRKPYPQLDLEPVYMLPRIISGGVKISL